MSWLGRMVFRAIMKELFGAPPRRRRHRPKTWRSQSVPWRNQTGLVHKTAKGHLVRSKSEVVIANALYMLDIPYWYERRLLGRVSPDFTFKTSQGQLVVWEHLGLLNQARYREKWAKKRAWYEQNGFVMGENLFTTTESKRGGLDSRKVMEIAQIIKAKL